MAAVAATLDDPLSILESDSTPARNAGLRMRGLARHTITLAIAALLLVLAWPLFSSRVYVADDLGAFHLPLRAFYAGQLARGEAFDWCPDLYCGFYLTGEGQAGAYHPLHLLLYRLMPLAVAFDLECWFSYPALLVGMYLFLRRWSIGRDAALFGGMVVAFGGFSMMHFVHPNAVAVSAHLPWLLLAVDVLLRSASAMHRRLAFAAVAGLTGSQLLLGYPQYVLFSLIAEAGYVALVCATERQRMTGRRFAWSALAWVAALVVGTAIAAVQVLPTIDALGQSARRTADANFALQGSLQPLNLTQLVAPYLFVNRVVGQNTHELSVYVGAVPLVMAALCLLRGRRGGALVSAASAAALFSLFWAFGEHGPFAWLLTHLPLVNEFRFPCRAIVLFQFAVAVLAAVGFGSIMRSCQAARQANCPALPRGLWLIPLASVAVSAFAAATWTEFLATWPLVVASPLLVSAATLLVVLAARGSQIALVGLIVLTAVDLGIYGMGHSIVGRTETLATFTSDVDVPPGQPTRVAADLLAGTEAAPLPTKRRVGDRILLAGWKRVDGYTGLEPARRLDYRRMAALQAAGVGWISKQALRQVASNEIAESSLPAWTRVENSRPRAWLATRALASANPAEDIQRIFLADEALVDAPIDLAPGSSGSVEIDTARPGSMALITRCTTAQLLVVNESHHCGWRATIDGQPAAVFRANGDFLGLLVPSGERQIRLEFAPASLRLGRLISGFGLGLMVVVIAWPRCALRP